MGRAVVGGVVVSLALLSGCAAGADNVAACSKYAEIISDWAISGDASDASTTGVAIKLRTEAAPLADAELTEAIREIAGAFAENSVEFTDAQSEAAEYVIDTCASLGVNLN